MRRVNVSIGALILVLIGFALRIYRISHQSVWWDEAYSLHMAREGIAVMLGLPGGATQIHWDQPPLYYLLLNLWVRLVGDSEFGLRTLSSFLGVSLLPVVHRVACRLFDRRTGLVALAVAALAPVYIVYSQEARVYAVLPLCYLLLIYLFHRLLEKGGGSPVHLWVALAFVEALCLYLHYFAVLGIAYLNLLFLAIELSSRWRRSRDGRPRDADEGWEQESGEGWAQGVGSLRRWIGSQVLAGLLFAPWAWNMVRHWDYFRSRGSIREPWVVSPGALPFAWRIWGFFVSGNEAAVQGISLLSTGVTILAAACGLALLLAALVRELAAAAPLLERTRSRRLWLALAHGLGPLTLCFLAWQFWPDAHPRYTLAYSIPLLLVIGRLLTLSLAPRARPFSQALAPVFIRAGGVLLACALILTGVTGLWAHYFDERFHKDEVRAVAAYLKEVTAADDVILVGPGDYSLQYYYDGPAMVSMARDEPRADKVRHLQEITAGRSRFFLVDWDPSKADLHELRPFLLERAGQLVAWRDFRGLDVRVYALHGDVGALPELRQPQTGARFGPLLLTGIYHEPTAANDNAVAVALRWRLVEPTERAYKVVVLLADGAGRRISSADVIMLDEAGRQTYAWPVWQGSGLPVAREEVNYYVVPVPVGTPPLPHRLAVGVYDAETLERLELADADGQPLGAHELALGEVALLPGRQFDRDPYGTWANVDWETSADDEMIEGLALERFAVSPRALLPGEEVSVLLRWRAADTAGHSPVPLLRLSGAGQVWAEAGSPLLAADYPFSEWSDGEVVVERRSLVYPPQRGPGDLTLTVGERALSLGQVGLDESRLLRELPSAAEPVGVGIGDFSELLGYELESGELQVGQPFELTLYWRATNDAPLQTAYTVFTQLLAADGHLIAQHDGPPAGNSRPTTTWIGSEVIEDAHRLVFQDLAYTGPATLIVGLYDAETIVRVGTAQGQDHFVLLADIVVGPAEE